jgi:uncharacterized protein YegL
MLDAVSAASPHEKKIGVLNQAVEAMLDAFAQERSPNVQIQVAVIAFGDGRAELHVPLTAAAAVTWGGMTAAGGTPMGLAFRRAEQLVQDRAVVFSHAYRPVLILASDGAPNDDWEPALELLDRAEHLRDADRFALAIGGDADETTLRRFLGRSDRQVHRAEDARQVREFFELAPRSVLEPARLAAASLVLDDLARPDQA